MRVESDAVGVFFVPLTERVERNRRISVSGSYGPKRGSQTSVMRIGSEVTRSFYGWSLAESRNRRKSLRHHLPMRWLTFDGWFTCFRGDGVNHSSLLALLDWISSLNQLLLSDLWPAKIARKAPKKVPHQRPRVPRATPIYRSYLSGVSWESECSVIAAQGRSN